MGLGRRWRDAVWLELAAVVGLIWLCLLLCVGFVGCIIGSVVVSTVQLYVELRSRAASSSRGTQQPSRQIDPIKLINFDRDRRKPQPHLTQPRPQQYIHTYIHTYIPERVLGVGPKRLIETPACCLPLTGLGWGSVGRRGRWTRREAGAGALSVNLASAPLCVCACAWRSETR